MTLYMGFERFLTAHGVRGSVAKGATKAIQGKVERSEVLDSPEVLLAGEYLLRAGVAPGGELSALRQAVGQDDPATVDNDGIQGKASNFGLFPKGIAGKVFAGDSSGRVPATKIQALAAKVEVLGWKVKVLGWKVKVLGWKVRPEAGGGGAMRPAMVRQLAYRIVAE